MYTPLEYAQVRDLGVRKIWSVKVRFNYPRPSDKSKKFGPYRKTKKHMEFTASILPTLDQSELFKILQGIQEGEVPWQFQDVVTELWNLKRQGQFPTEIILGDGVTELIPINYPEGAKLVDHYEEL